MHEDKPNVLLAEVNDRLNAISTVIDRQIASDDPDLSYAATTAALHLHAAQAEVTPPDPGAYPPPAYSGQGLPGRAVDALADVVALINDSMAVLPAEHQTATVRVALHLAEARDALGGTST